MTEAISTVRHLAAQHGFDGVGITSAEPVREAREALRRWCDAGYAADMGWMGRDPTRRADPTALLRDARTVVVVAVAHGAPPMSFAAEGRYGRVAAYAGGRDYHDLVLPRLRALAEALAGAFSGGRRATKAACDHSPLMERALAVRAGLGFQGKNTCLLLPRGGSWFLLGEILLDVPLPPTSPSGTDHCGTCRACLDACPTGAFAAPYVLDSRRCVSYLTIEHRGVIPRELRARLGAWVFGCDACQEGCPFNRFAPPAAWPELEAEAGVGSRLDLVEVLSIADDDAFRARFAGTPLLRPKRAGILRNAAVVARNVGAETAVPALLDRLECDPEPIVRLHALWALFGLAPRRARRAAERVLERERDAEVRAEARDALEAS